ncbi:uncharacterized protein LOC133885316 [Phragmites australis]|uniref:uncharacterized protein LOC133885316 n=1 Tax=Phragmites australis TaxID=29695 RepID=UPI002D76A579|nr:uncharacterized protein LOC133885316 [Phragmites australis]
MSWRSTRSAPCTPYVQKGITVVYATRNLGPWPQVVRNIAPLVITKLVRQRREEERDHSPRVADRVLSQKPSIRIRKMRRVLPLCALLLVVLLCAASLADVTEARRGGRGSRGTYIGGAGGARGNHSGGPRGLSGGTWTACVGSSLLAAAGMLL